MNDDGSTAVDEISVVSKHNLPVREALTLVRSSIVRHIGRIFGTDAGIVSALIVGDKTALQSDRTEAYRATGSSFGDFRISHGHHCRNSRPFCSEAQAVAAHCIRRNRAHHVLLHCGICSRHRPRLNNGHMRDALPCIEPPCGFAERTCRRCGADTCV